LDETILPAMVLRVKNESNLPQDIIHQCLNKKLAKIEAIAIVDRVSEKEFLDEMKRQSSLPVNPESVIQIGKLLAPDHLLIINDETVKISNIESGKLLHSMSISFDPIVYNLNKNFILFVKIIAFLPIFILIYYLFYLIFLPVQMIGKKLEDNHQANKLLRMAKDSLNSNNLRTASEQLVKCAKMGKQFKASREAHQILYDIILDREKI
jgi:hypothetical protein